LSLCFFNVNKNFHGFTMNFVISATTIFSSIFSRPTYGCTTNGFAILWLWAPQINFTIQLSPPKTGFAPNLNGHPHFLLPVHVLTKLCFLDLYLPLLSQAINRNKALPRTPVLVFDLIITTTNPISWANDWAHCKTSSRLANNYNIIQIRSNINKHLCNIIIVPTTTNYTNTWEVLKASKQSTCSILTPTSSSFSTFISTSSYINWSLSILIKHLTNSIQWQKIIQPPHLLLTQI